MSPIPDQKRKRSLDDVSSGAAPEPSPKKSKDDSPTPGDTLVWREPRNITPPPSLTVESASGVLSQYAGALRNNLALHGPEWTVTEYDAGSSRKEYSATLSLPFNSPVRFAQGDRQLSKKLAKGAASLSAVKQLMQYGEIGADLTFHPMHPGHRSRKESKNAVDPNRRRRAYIMGPKWWAESPPLDPGNLFGSVITLNVDEFPDKAADCRPLLLITLRPLPFDGGKFDVSGNKVQAFVQLSPSFPFRIRPKDLDRAVTYSTVLFQGICHRIMAPDPGHYLILPLRWTAGVTDKHPLSRGHITWGEVVDTCKEPLQTLVYRDYDALKEQCEGRVVCGATTSVRWVVRGVRGDLRADSIRDGDARYATLGKGERKTYGYMNDANVTVHDQPLLDVEAEIDNIVTGVISNLEAESPRRELVLPELLGVHSISAGTFLSASILPIFLPMLDAQLLGMEMSQTMFGGRIKPHFAREAITPSQARPVLSFQDYQRVEMLGDSVLRLAVTCLLYCQMSEPTPSGSLPTEGALVNAGNFIQQNTTLTAGAEKANIAGYIRGVYFPPTDWVPVGWAAKRKSKSEATITQELGKKVMADVAEALIGATLLSTDDSVLRFLSNREGLEGVLATMRDLKVPAPALKWADLRGLKLPAEVLEQVSSEPLTVLGYTFKDPAKGHIAFSMTKARNHFERYELIGDALVGLMTTLHLWDAYPEASSAALTNAKQSRVSNGSLVAFLVSSGLVDQLTDARRVPGLAAGTSRVAAGLRAAQARTDALDPEDQHSDYWTAVPSSKNLADQVEALFGAILDDSDFDPHPALKVYNDHVAPFMRKYALPPNEGGPHPHSVLQRMLGKRNCHQMSKQLDNVYGEDGKIAKVTATVTLHGEVVGVAEAETRQVAERLAFSAAVDHVKRHPDNPLCQCKRK